MILQHQFETPYTFDTVYITVFAAFECFRREKNDT